MIEKLIWDSEKYSVGQPLLDSQHQRIIEMINKLIDLSENGHTKVELREVCNQMLRYAESHFRYEETLFRSVDAPDLNDHIRSHKQYTERVTYMMAEESWCDVESLLFFLVDWFAHHILIEDMKYKPLFISRLTPSTVSLSIEIKE